MPKLDPLRGDVIALCSVRRNAIDHSGPSTAKRIGAFEKISTFDASNPKLQGRSRILPPAPIRGFAEVTSGPIGNA